MKSIRHSRILSLREFLHADYPEPTLAHDFFSGLDAPDLVVNPPDESRAGKFLVITLLTTARYLQVGKICRVNPERIAFLVAAPDSLHIADIRRACYLVRPFMNGFQLDVAILVPADRELIRGLPIPKANIEDYLPKTPRAEVRQ